MFGYCDGAHFSIACAGDEIFADWPDSLSLEDIAVYLVGPILGVVLRLRGVIPLHASAVSIADYAIAVAGPAEAGKSTTAAAFASCGYRVISDDVVALREEGSRFLVPPGYPRVNLWAESVEGILGENDRLPLNSPNWEKRFMPLEAQTQFEARSLPLGAIYLLERREKGLRTPVVEPISDVEAFMALMGNTYMNYLPDTGRQRHEFELLGRVVANVPIRRVVAPSDFSMLPDLAGKIAADAASTVRNTAYAKGFGEKERASQAIQRLA
jgi:hypothetical protein